MLTIKKILVPTDFSNCSERAFQLACSLAHDHGAQLVVVHVVEPPVIVHGGVMTPPPPDVGELDRNAIRQRLDRFIPSDTDVKVTHRLVDGNPLQEILKLAGETKPDMIVIGTHGRRGISRLLMGSVAEGVLRSAECPVVTVKDPV